MYKSKYKNLENEQLDTGAKSSFEEEIIYNDFTKRRTISILGEINEKTEFLTNHMIQQLCKEDKNGEKLPIRIKISSGGGDALSAFSIIDSIDTAKDMGYTIITEGYSTIMSAAVPILSSGSFGFRKCQKKSRWMVHNVGVFLMGSMSGEEVSRLSVDLNEISGAYEELLSSTSHMTKEQFREHSDKIKEFYFWGTEALELGFVDSLF